MSGGYFGMGKLSWCSKEAIFALRAHTSIAPSLALRAYISMYFIKLSALCITKALDLFRASSCDMRRSSFETAVEIMN